jgi:2-iminobutanoate/2-iminopropanoate deaminase
MKNTSINPASIKRPMGRFSHGLLSKPGQVLAISGQVGIADGEAQDFASQTRKNWENIKTIIEAAGGAMSDIVSVNIYLKDIKDYKYLDEVRKDFLVEPYPASTAIGGIQFAIPEMEVEISVIAVI